MCQEMCSWIARLFGTCLPMKRVFFATVFHTGSFSHWQWFVFLLFITATAITTLGRVEPSTNGRPGGAYGMDHRHHTHTHTLTFILTSSTRKLEKRTESFRHGTSPLPSNPHPQPLEQENEARVCVCM